MLAKEFTILVARRRLVAITVLPGRNTTGSPHSAWVHGTTMVLHADFLKAQHANRLFDVVHPDDILPGNTVFCLGHLAYHLAIDAPASPGANMEIFIRRLEREAGAFLQGWNNVVDAAVHANGGKPLSKHPGARLMLNMRYRFALMKLGISENGFIEASPGNIETIVATLRTSPVADIE